MTSLKSTYVFISRIACIKLFISDEKVVSYCIVVRRHKMPFLSSLLATSSLLYRLCQGAPCGAKLKKAKTGRRYMKEYREKFMQYFPTLLEELTDRGLFDAGLKHNAEHLKEVSPTAKYSALSNSYTVIP